MRADYRELQGESWYGLYNTLNAYYGEWGESMHSESIAKGREPQPSAECRAMHQKKRGKNNRYTLLLWNKKNPQYFSMWMLSSLETYITPFEI